MSGKLLDGVREFVCGVVLDRRLIAGIRLRVRV